MYAITLTNDSLWLKIDESVHPKPPLTPVAVCQDFQLLLCFFLPTFCIPFVLHSTRGWGACSHRSRHLEFRVSRTNSQT